MIETNRLILRNFSEDDTEGCFISWGQDISTGKYIPFFPMKSIEEMASFVNAMADNKDAWVICLKDGTPVGYAAVDIPYPQLKTGEIGYLIGESFQRKGYGIEAVSAVLKEYLVNRGMYLMEAKCNEDNKASQMLLEKIGFIKEARLRDRRTDMISGERKALLIYSITKNELQE